MGWAHARRVGRDWLSSGRWRGSVRRRDDHRVPAGGHWSGCRAFPRRRPGLGQPARPCSWPRRRVHGVRARPAGRVVNGPHGLFHGLATGIENPVRPAGRLRRVSSVRAQRGCGHCHRGGTDSTGQHQAHALRTTRWPSTVWCTVNGPALQRATRHRTARAALVTVLRATADRTSVLRWIPQRPPDRIPGLGQTPMLSAIVEWSQVGALGSQFPARSGGSEGHPQGGLVTRRFECHSFTAELATLWTKNRWKARNRTTMGRTRRVPKAKTAPQSGGC